MAAKTKCTYKFLLHPDYPVTQMFWILNCLNIYGNMCWFTEFQHGIFRRK